MKALWLERKPGERELLEHPFPTSLLQRLSPTCAPRCIVLLQWSRRPCTHHSSKRYACTEPLSSHSPCKAEGSSFPFRRKYFCLLSLPWRFPFINLICQLCLRVAKGERAASIENILSTHMHACTHSRCLARMCNPKRGTQSLESRDLGSCLSESPVSSSVMGIKIEPTSQSCSENGEG